MQMQRQTMLSNVGRPGPRLLLLSVGSRPAAPASDGRRVEAGGMAADGQTVAGVNIHDSQNFLSPFVCVPR